MKIKKGYYTRYLHWYLDSFRDGVLLQCLLYLSIPMSPLFLIDHVDKLNN